MANAKSGLEYYGLGIVAVNKPLDTDEIMVTPIERIPAENGRLKDVTEEYETTGVDHQGVETKEKVQGGVTLKAKWIPGSDNNRQTAPDVVEGETVKLYRYAGVHEYYWESIYREPSLRRLERVTYAFSNLRAPGKAFDKESSYWLEYSTQDKHVWLQTTRSDGEAYSYRFRIDTARNHIALQDDASNQLELFSDDNHWRMGNGAGSFFGLNGVTSWTQTSNLVRLSSPMVHINSPVVVIDGMLMARTISSGSMSGGNGFGSAGASGMAARFAAAGGPHTCSGEDGDLSAYAPVGEENYHDRPDWKSGADAYHDTAFVRCSQELHFARIGHAWQSYSHYDNATLETVVDESITITTPLITEDIDARVENLATKEVNATGNISIKTAAQWLLDAVGNILIKTLAEFKVESVTAEIDSQGGLRVHNRLSADQISLDGVDLAGIHEGFKADISAAQETADEAKSKAESAGEAVEALPPQLEALQQANEVLSQQLEALVARVAALESAGE